MLLTRRKPDPVQRPLARSWLTLVLALNLCGLASAAGAEGSKPAVVGAGAHFAWVVFEMLKPDLERASGRKIELHGKHSMLGVGCKAGIKTALMGGDHFGFVCCPLAKSEVEKKKLMVHPLAREPLLTLVNAGNPVSNLSVEQVRSIFRGDITNWKEVGGKDMPIVVVARLHCKSRPGHWKTILPDAGLFRQQRLSVASASEMVQRVSDFPGAIGHLGSTWIFDAKARVKPVTVSGFAATAENLANGKYPFYRELSVVTDRQPSPDVLKIIKEAQTGPAFRKVARQFELLPAVER